MSTAQLFDQYVRSVRPRTFYLYRSTDDTGVSGTGMVAEGAEFSDGTCVLRWLTETSSTAVYASMADLVAIHGHSGATVPVDAHGRKLT